MSAVRGPRRLCECCASMSVCSIRPADDSAALDSASRPTRHSGHSRLALSLCASDDLAQPGERLLTSADEAACLSSGCLPIAGDFRALRGSCSPRRRASPLRSRLYHSRDSSRQMTSDGRPRRVPKDGASAMCSITTAHGPDLLRRRLTLCLASKELSHCPVSPASDELDRQSLGPFPAN